MKGRTIAILLLLLHLFVKAQSISTFAGGGISGLGDGGPATAARLDDPINGVFDKYGNYYFAEGSGERVRKINLSNIITTLAGDGSSGFGGDGTSATSAIFFVPNTVRLDTFGNLYIADGGNNRIRKINISTGIISTIVGNGTGAFLGDGGSCATAEIWDPQDICFDKFGNLYIADAFNARVRKVNPSGIISTYAGNGISAYSGEGVPATIAGLALPTGLAVDDTGNLYIADVSGNRVRKVDTFGVMTTFAGNGNGSYTGDGIPAVSAQINPGKLAIDSSGKLIIADQYNLRVYKVDGSGIIHNIAGDGMTGFSGDGGIATAAAIDYPGGVSFDPCWNLYIFDIDYGRIRKISYNPSCSLHSLDSLASLKTNEINSAANISIYPNPAYDELTINSSNKIAQITISNLIGQVAASRDGLTPALSKGAGGVTQARVDVSVLPPGVYVVRVTDVEGNVVVRKVVKSEP